MISKNWQDLSKPNKLEVKVDVDNDGTFDEFGVGRQPAGAEVEVVRRDAQAGHGAEPRGA